MGTTSAEELRQLASESLLAHYAEYCEGAVIVDADARIVWMNKRYPERLGIAVPECVVGKEIEQVIPNSLMRQVVESGQPIMLDVMEYGDAAFVVTRLPLHDKAGKVLGAVGFMLYDDPRHVVSLITRYQRLHSDLAEATVALVSALGSAIFNNHPMALVNAAALGGDSAAAQRDVLAALVGGDLGPRLLPIGSLAGLLWLDALRRQGIRVSFRTFARVGMVTTIPSVIIGALVVEALSRTSP